MCVKQCVNKCCCFDLKTGSKIIGWLGIIIQVISIIYIIVEWSEPDVSKPPSYGIQGLSLSNLNSESISSRIQSDLQNDKENDEFKKAVEELGKALGDAMKEMENNPDFQNHRRPRMAG